MAPEPDTSGVRVFPPAIYAAGIALGYLIRLVWPVRLVPVAWRAEERWLGWSVLVLGVLLAGSAAATFRRAGTTPNPTRPTTALAFGGPYRLTRNPMYLGLALLHAGAALILDSAWVLVTLSAVLWIVRRAVIDREERYLEAKFGAGYLDYKRRVRRWL